MTRLPRPSKRVESARTSLRVQHVNFLYREPELTLHISTRRSNTFAFTVVVGEYICLLFVAQSQMLGCVTVLSS